MKNLFKVLTLSLLACPLFSSAMNPTTLCELQRTGHEQEASDFEIYQLLSFAAKNNPDFSIPADIVNAIARTAYDITEEENIAIAHEIDRTQALKKRIAKQNQTMQNLTDEARTLMKEIRDPDEENKHLQALINEQGKFIDETSFSAHSCLTQ